MSMTRKITFWLVTKVGWLIFLLLGRLTRTTVINQHYYDELKQSEQGFLSILWHGRIFLPIYHHRNQAVVAMVSQHGDGEMIAQTIHKLGFRTVRGSSTRGGQQALRNMVKELRHGKVGTMMPDGPKGPRHYFKEGALFIAQLARVPLLPMTYSADRFFQFNSWDKFMLVKPFSRSIIMYGEPINVPVRLQPEEKEKFREVLENRLIQLEKAADEYFRK